MRKLLSMAIIASMTMVSCSKQENPEKIDFSQDKEIKLNAGITASTKAAYEPNDAVSDVQFLRMDVASATAPDFSTGTSRLVTGSIGTDGAIVITPVENYDITADLNAWFVGYFPALDTGTSTWTIDGKKDIMTTAPVNAGKYSDQIPDAKMAFGHRLAQLVVKCEAATGVSTALAQAAWGDITKIEVLDAKNIVTYTKGTTGVAFSGSAPISLLQSDMETSFGSATIAAYGAGAEVAGAMVAPSSTNIKLQVTTKKGTDSEKKTTVTVNLTSFVESTKNTITLYFGASDVPIGTNATIGVWENGGTGSGEVK